MLARFDSRIQQRGNLRHSDAPRNTLWLLTGLMALFLISWLVYRYLVQPAWIGRLPAILTEFLFLIEAASIITVGILAAVITWRHRRQARPRSILIIEEMQTLMILFLLGIKHSVLCLLLMCSNTFQLAMQRGH